MPRSTNLEIHLVAELILEKLQKENSSIITTRAAAGAGPSQTSENVGAMKMALEYFKNLAATTLAQNQMIKKLQRWNVSIAY